MSWGAEFELGLKLREGEGVIEEKVKGHWSLQTGEGEGVIEEKVKGHWSLQTYGLPSIGIIESRHGQNNRI